ncbi:MAG: hypothetical protein P8182_14920 [Deltaproteobacteria bacterium]
MEQLIVQSIVQGGGVASDWWSCLGDYWQWSFWIGVLVGLVGTVVLFLFKPVENS